MVLCNKSWLVFSVGLLLASSCLWCTVGLTGFRWQVHVRWIIIQVLIVSGCYKALIKHLACHVMSCYAGVWARNSAAWCKECTCHKFISCRSALLLLLNNLLFLSLEMYSNWDTVNPLQTHYTNMYILLVAVILVEDALFHKNKCWKYANVKWRFFFTCTMHIHNDVYIYI